ncbi:MAG: universal stress protein [Acidimicrobiales bacterium]
MSTTIERAARIVVGVDGSDSSLAALNWAARQAELTGSSVEAVIAWRLPMSYGFPVPVAPNFDLAGEASRVLDDAITSIRSAHPKMAIETSVREGYAAHVLVGASRDAELLVVGSSGHGELTGMLLGSVSEYCVAHSHCPVLIVPSSHVVHA